MNARKIEELIRKQARHFGIRVYQMANAGNHVHLVVLVTNRRTLAGFLRAVCGLIARVTLGAERGRGASQTQFWDFRPFSRILSWGRDYLSLRKYLMMNRLETAGFERGSLRVMLQKIEELQKNSQLAATGFG